MGVSQPTVQDRIHALQEAVQEPRTTLQSVSSAESVRTNAGQGLATLPYLTINDIIALRGAEYGALEDLEERILDVPGTAWDHVLDLVRARVVRVQPTSLKAAVAATPSKSANGSNGSEVDGDHNPRCLALTKSGDRCKNHARGGSKYCSSHKGYQPSRAELEARKQGLLA